MRVCDCELCAGVSYVDRCRRCGIAWDRHGVHCGFETGDVAPAAPAPQPRGDVTCVAIPECDLYAWVASRDLAERLIEFETGAVVA